MTHIEWHWGEQIKLTGTHTPPPVRAHSRATADVMDMPVIVDNKLSGNKEK